MNKDLLKKNLEITGIDLDERAFERLAVYSERLKETNRFINLTAVTDDDGIAVKHFADSLSLLTAFDFKDGLKVMDLGTGAGFPGAVLLIARPGIKLTLLDSTAKKLNFISETLNILGLNAETLHSRCEDAGKDAAYREKFDLVVSRAVANMKVLSEYCLPFVKKGGVFIAMKSQKAGQEIDEAKEMIKTLGGEIKEIRDINLTDGAHRCLVIVEKSGETPKKYPRNPGKIK
ncbi:MAG: 16S rRNA (guanine(527)-N(7))-methyltransferase RsmG [Clostridiales bacterium]|nr:16S rRNA (guanine(527)-N(7))-methyltransferase RsmG [Clostridiales bacterium]